VWRSFYGMRIEVAIKSETIAPDAKPDPAE